MKEIQVQSAAVRLSFASFDPMLTCYSFHRKREIYSIEDKRTDESSPLSPIELLPDLIPSSRSRSFECTRLLIRTTRLRSCRIDSASSIWREASESSILKLQVRPHFLTHRLMTEGVRMPGDRLKEAGNINKSLMVLGQCMEVMRKNQELDKGRKVRLHPSLLWCGI